MNELDALITLVAILFMFMVMGTQGYMLGNLLMGKLLEYYDVYIIKGFSNALLVERGYCTSSESCKNVYFEMIKQAKNGSADNE